MKGLLKGGEAYVLKMAMTMGSKENSVERFGKILTKPCTDERKVSFYKWGVKYRKRGQKGENDLEQRKKADQKVWKGSKKRLIFGAGKEKNIKQIFCGIKTKRETRLSFTINHGKGGGK